MSSIEYSLVKDRTVDPEPGVSPTIQAFRALYRPDRIQSALVEPLHALLDELRSERVTLVWTPRDSGTMPYPHTGVARTLDPVPTSFPPGLFLTEMGNERIREVGSDLRIDAGGDGSRSWSIVVEKVGGPFDPDALIARVRGLRNSLANPRGPSILWGFLADLEGRESDAGAERDIRTRIAVADHLRVLLDHGLVTSNLLREDTNRLLDTLPRSIRSSDESVHWRSLLMALRDPTPTEISAISLTWGESLESVRHLRGALEAFKLAFRSAVLAMDTGAAIDAARYCGRVNRELSQSTAAFGWYEHAREIAAAVGDIYRLGLVHDGIGNTFRDRGNHPDARKAYGEVLRLGQVHALPELVGRAHHALLVLENLAGERVAAAHHGWNAVQAYPENASDRLRVLFDLGAVLLDLRVFDASEQAFRIVGSLSEEADLRIFSLISRAEIAAHQGSEATALNLMAEADADEGIPTRWVHAQMCITRGLSFEALNRFDDARDWYEKGLADARRHGLYQVVYDAEERIQALKDVIETEATASQVSRSVEPLPQVSPEEVGNVRQGLFDLGATIAV